MERRRKRQKRAESVEGSGDKVTTTDQIVFESEGNLLPNHEKGSDCGGKFPAQDGKMPESYSNPIVFCGEDENKDSVVEVKEGSAEKVEKCQEFGEEKSNEKVEAEETEQLVNQNVIKAQGRKQKSKGEGVPKSEGNLLAKDEKGLESHENLEEEKNEIKEDKTRDFSDNSETDVKVEVTEELVSKDVDEESPKKKRGRKKGWNKAARKISVEEKGMKNCGSLEGIGERDGQQKVELMEVSVEKAEGVGWSSEAIETVFMKSRLRSDRRKVSYEEIDEDGKRGLKKKIGGKGGRKKENLKGEENVVNEMEGGGVSNLKSVEEGIESVERENETSNSLASSKVQKQENQSTKKRDRNVK